MKRIISMLVCMSVMLFQAQALAITDLEAQVYNHNSYAEITGASIIEGDPETDAGNKYIVYRYEVNGVHIAFATDNDKVAAFSCTADNEHFSEFFSQCMSCMYNFKGVNSAYIWAHTFLDELAAAKAGKRSADDIDQFKKMQFFTSDGMYGFYLER